MLATLLVALAAAGAVTYAWYIYNANRHITDVKMAAGTGVTFLISNEYDGEYKTNAGLSFAGLLDPVSTDNVLNGFQKVTGFTGGTTQDSLFASMFGAAEHSDYYKTSLYLATNSAATDVYLSGIDFTEQDPANPISTALRVGLVAYAPGQGDTVTGQYVFEVSGEHNPQAQRSQQLRVARHAHLARIQVHVERAVAALKVQRPRKSIVVQLRGAVGVVGRDARGVLERAAPKAGKA